MKIVTAVGPRSVVAGRPRIPRNADPTERVPPATGPDDEFAIALVPGRALLRSRSSVRVIEIGPSGVVLELAGGERFAVQVDARRYVSRLMVTLPVRRPSRRTLLVTRDMLDGALFRRLRLWAIWGKLPSVAGKQLPA